MRARRMLLGVLGVLGVLYLVLGVAARVLYPRVLFPAPRLDRPGDADGAAVLALPQGDGTHTAALHWPPREADAPTVVIFHGNGETMFDLVPVARALRARGLGVLVVEYRGYGTTFGPPPEESALYADGEAALAWLEARTARIAVLGYSLGTSVAAEMAFRGHGQSLVLLAPFTSLAGMGRELAPVLPASLVLRHRLDTLAKAPAIRQPALVFHGEADALIPVAMGEAVARALPHGELVRVKGGAHADLLAPALPGVGPTREPGADAIFDRIAHHVRPR